MPTYNVPLTGIANITVTVETNETDEQVIADLAMENVRASLCHECSSKDSLELGDEWDPTLLEGKPEVIKISG